MPSSSCSRISKGFVFWFFSSRTARPPNIRVILLQISYHSVGHAPFKVFCAPSYCLFWPSPGMATEIILFTWGLTSTRVVHELLLLSSCFLIQLRVLSQYFQLMRIWIVYFILFCLHVFGQISDACCWIVLPTFWFSWLFRRFLNGLGPAGLVLVFLSLQFSYSNGLSWSYCDWFSAHFHTHVFSFNSDYATFNLLPCSSIS